MDSATEEIYFQKLEEYVQDDDKIVTIPSFARIAEISIKDSQHLLSRYLKDQRKLKPKELCLTYVLNGSLKDGGKAVIIVKEADLAEKRILFDNIESQVLFSVQKCKLIDFNVLSLVDDVTQASEAPLLGSIVSKNCVKRILKVKKLPTPPPSTIKGKSSYFMPKTQSSSSAEKSTESSGSKTDVKPKQNGIASMFGKAVTQTSKENYNTDKKPTSTNSTNNKPKGGLSAFLSKGSSTSNSSIKSENGVKREYSTSIESQPSELEELMEVDFQELDEEVETSIKKGKGDNKDKKKVEVKEEKKSEVKEEKKKGTKKSEEKDRKSKSKRQREKSEEKVVKKRKRIVERNDSESDDMFENDDADVIEKSDDEPERAPSPVTKKPLAPKNKIRKAVDKTYMDEEGYIVTKTEYVYESAPEDDEEVPVPTKKEEKPKLNKKASASSENDVSPPKGAKGKKGKKNNMQNQPTLMNFFKKK